MGAFNTVKTEGKCKACGNVVELTIQFKYALCWQFEYKLGDSLDWSERRFGNIGKPGHKRVVVDAVAEHCPLCHAEGEDYEVWLENDKIAAVTPSSGKYKFWINNETYIVVEE